MLIRAQLSLEEASYSQLYTPSPSAQRLPFYLTTAGHFFARPGYYTERRDLAEYLLFFTLSGAGSMTVEGTDYALEANQLFFLDCRQYHIYQTQGADGWEFYYLQFAGGGVEEYYHLFYEQGIRPLSTRHRDSLIPQFERILHLPAGNTRAANLQAAHLISGVLTQLILEQSYIPDPAQYDRYSRDVSDAMEYMEQNYRRALSLEEIAGRLHMSKHYFIRTFKRITGITPYEYLLDYRINSSKELLKSTPLSVEEIANQVGYPDAGSFIRSFRKRTGITPLQYRKS